MNRTFLTAEWRSLVMINYAVEPAVLAPHVPRGVELDPWEGEALVTVERTRARRDSLRLTTRCVPRRSRHSIGSVAR